MPRSLSTTLSDAVLAISSYHAAGQMLGKSVTAFVSFVTIGTAASFGTVRFILDNPSGDLVSYHKYLSFLATAIGMPYLASAYHQQEGFVFVGNVLLASGFILVVVYACLSEQAKDLGAEILSGIALISILLLCVIYNNVHGIAGSFGYIVAGLVIKTDGTFLGFKRVDIFHYILAIANFSLMLGLQNKFETEFST